MTKSSTLPYLNLCLKGDIEMMGHHMDDTDRMSYNAVASQEDVEKNEIVEGYVECKKCGDHVMKEFLGRHMRMIHGEDGPVAITPLKQSSPRPRNIIMRACPECGVEMRSDSITKHCKLKHKVSILVKWAFICMSFSPQHFPKHSFVS